MEPPENADEVTALIGELHEQAQRMARALDVLVWTPVLSPGGGVRLLLSLVPALRRQSTVRSVRLAAPVGSLDIETIRLLRAVGVAVIELTGRRRDGVVEAHIVRDGGHVLAVKGTAAWQQRTVSDLARGCDVVYVPWPHLDSPPRIDVPIVATYQDTTLLEYPEGFDTRAAAEKEHSSTAAWLHETTLVVSSEATARNLVRLFGPDVVGSPTVIHHAIRPDPPVPISDAPVPDGLPANYIVFAGNIAVHKNLEHVLTAWSRFELRRECPLVVLGHDTLVLRTPGPQSNWRGLQLWGLVKRLGLGPDNGLHALGYVPDGAVRPIIAGAAALIVASYTEGGGSFPAEEAMTAGVPVLCSDIPVLREHLGRRSAQVTWFDPHSVDSILAALTTFVADRESLRASAWSARDDKRPTWDDVAAQYAELFVAVAS